jgi:hypothetical protein
VIIILYLYIFHIFYKEHYKNSKFKYSREFISSMKRKIIELGHDCMVVSLPRKWVVENKLKKGDELEIASEGNNLQVSLSEKKKKIQEITIELEDIRETLTRAVIVNNYRIGYDRIILKYSGKKKELTDIVDKHLLGFDIFQKSDGNYVIESVSEPSYEEFNNIINKVFFIMNGIIENFHKENIQDDVIKIQKYDNFLKRCISKTLFDPKTKMFLWQFLSELTRISKEFQHLGTHLKVPVTINKYEQKLIGEIKSMMQNIQKAYLTKDMTYIKKLYIEDQKFIDSRKEIFSKIRNPITAYHIVHIARIMFLLNSSLIGIINVEES